RGIHSISPAYLLMVLQASEDLFILLQVIAVVQQRIKGVFPPGNRMLPAKLFDPGTAAELHAPFFSEEPGLALIIDHLTGKGIADGRTRGPADFPVAPAAKFQIICCMKSINRVEVDRLQWTLDAQVGRCIQVIPPARHEMTELKA